MSNRRRLSLSPDDASTEYRSYSAHRACSTQVGASRRHCLLTAPFVTSVDAHYKVNATFRASMPLPKAPYGFWDVGLESQQAAGKRPQSHAAFMEGMRMQRESVQALLVVDNDHSGIPVPPRAIDSPPPFARPLSRPMTPPRAAPWDAKDFKTHARSRPQLGPSKLSTPARLQNRGAALKRLPKEILDFILLELETLHLHSDVHSNTCATCCMRDLCSLAVTSKQWSTAARPKLFESICLVGHDSVHQLKKFKMKHGTRLKLLRRSLRERPDLASHVRELKLPDTPDTALTKEDQEKYLDQVASVIMACPNLERLRGLHQPYRYQHSRLTHALTTRPKLTEHVWTLAPMLFPKDLRKKGDTEPTSPAIARVAEPNAEQSLEFVTHHVNWQNMSTFVCHCSAASVIHPLTLMRTLAQLRSLAHLTLSGIPNLPQNILLKLPPLKSLHLSNLPSLPEQALSAFATTFSASTVQSLTLTHINLASLAVLARLLANLISLTHLTIIQDTAPMLPPDSNIFLQPYLASAKLRYLTWDVLVPSDTTAILATSIANHGFPSLRRLKAPGDHDGLLQALCQPRERMELPGDRYAKVATNVIFRKDSGIEGVNTPCTGTSVDSGSFVAYSRSLTAARLAAQARIDAAKLQQTSRVSIWECSEDDEPVAVATFEMGGYIGRVGTDSRIVYDLAPDLEGKDEAGVVVEDLIAAKEAVGNFKEMCDGSWNRTPGTDDRKDRGKRWGWEHKERPRWRATSVSLLS